MLKVKLTTTLINNAIELYTMCYESILSSSELDKLKVKLLNTIEFDVVKNYTITGKDVPNTVLFLIYAIGEYKKAYRDSKKEHKQNRQQTLESLGKGFAKRKHTAKELRIIMNDESLDIETRTIALFQRILFLGIRNKVYSKIGLTMLGYMFMNYPFYFRIFRMFHAYSNKALKVIDDFEESFKFFEYTYLSQDKISNTLLIILYSRLKFIGIDENIAFRFSKDIVRTYLDTDSIPTDKYRISYLKNNDIYFAGLYGGLPIYQWYSGKNESYYSDKDIKQFQRFMRLIKKEKKESSKQLYIANYMFKKLQPNPTLSLNEVFNILESDNAKVREIILDMHMTFVKTPWHLIAKVIPVRLTLYDRLYSVFLLFKTIFAGLKTKFT